MALALKVEEGDRETECVVGDEAVRRAVGEDLSSWHWCWRWKKATETESVAVDKAVRRAVGKELSTE